MINIKRIDPFQHSNLYFFDVEKNKLHLVGQIQNELELFEIRSQIKKEKLFGYEIHWNEHVIPILSNGSLLEYPKGFYDKSLEYLDFLTEF